MTTSSAPVARPDAPASHAADRLRLRHLGLDTNQEAVVFMSADCPVCRSEGWEAQARLGVTLGDRFVVATLHVVTAGLLAPDEASLSEYAWRALEAREGAIVAISHAPPAVSMGDVRAKLYGARLDDAALRRIVGDIATSRLSSLEVAAFVAACAAGRLDLDEVTSLTRAMVDVGDRLSWPGGAIVDKHSVGGLPGNRTTLIVVPIVAAFGLTMPKTSSRAITSPAGTADAMETLAPVALDVPAMRRVVEREGGCIVWGGAVRLSPADDAIIRVERPLDIDSEGQLVASVLSKKAAAGSTHVVIDMPVGPTAKVRGAEAARVLSALLRDVGARIGLQVDVVTGDGAQPIGRGVGPALEARDAVAVLRGDDGAPSDLRDRALVLAGRIIELAAGAAPGSGQLLARRVLDSGAAWVKFQAICDAQGGLGEPPRALHTLPVGAPRDGVVTAIDNRRLARTAKLAGAPRAPEAGLELHVRVDQVVAAGEPLFTLHARSPGELAWAASFAAENVDMMTIGERP